jgi:cytochrome P450
LLNEGTQTYTNKNLRDTMLNFVIGGRDTTTVTLSWFVYIICSHPDVADKIHEELCAFEKEREKEEEEANFNHYVGISFLEDTLSNFSHRVEKFSEHLAYESLLKL